MNKHAQFAHKLSVRTLRKIIDIKMYDIPRWA